MPNATPSPNLSPGKAAKGSKAACEAAGWVFQPAAYVFVENGRHVRRDGRGVTAIAPKGSGIDPMQHGGMGRAVAWAVEQSARIAEAPPAAAIAGRGGIRMLLGLALASGEICGGEDEVPARPDAELLSICGEAIACDRRKTELDEGRWSGGKDPAARAFYASYDAVRDALTRIPALHATTREGLLQKARAILIALDTVQFTGGQKLDMARSVLTDLIHLVPTIDDRSPIQPVRRGAAASQPPRTGEPA